MGWAACWAIFSQTHLLTLLLICKNKQTNLTQRQGDQIGGIFVKITEVVHICVLLIPMVPIMH
jgi:hypothetical protein